MAESESVYKLARQILDLTEHETMRIVRPTTMAPRLRSCLMEINTHPNPMVELEKLIDMHRETEKLKPALCSRAINGFTALHVACYYADHVEMLKMLLGAGADPTLKNKFGKTPLGCARQLGRVQCIEILDEALMMTPEERIFKWATGTEAELKRQEKGRQKLEEEEVNFLDDSLAETKSP